MKSFKLGVFACLIGTMLIGGHSVCLAQDGDKPDATPEPVPVQQGPDIEAWRKAYEVAGRPTILVLCGWTTGAQQVADPGNTLWNFDDSGTAAGIRTAFEKIINDPAADVELVADDARRAAQTRLASVLTTRDEKEAIALLHTELSAELIVIIKLHGKMGATPTRVIVEASQADVSRKGFQQTFDWKVGTRQSDINAVVNRLATVFIEDFSGRAARPVQRLTVRVLGLMTREDATAARESFKKSGGVSGVNRRNVETGKRDSVSEFEVSFEGRYDADDVVDALAEGLAGTLKSDVTTVKEEGKNLTFRVSPKTAPTQEFVKSCQEVITSGSDAGAAKIKEFKSLYKSRNSPRIALMVNRAQTKEEKESAAAMGNGVSAENVIIVSSAGRDVNNGTGSNATTSGGKNTSETVANGFYSPQEVEALARSLEAELARCFKSKYELNFTVVDADDMRRRLMEKVDTGKNVLRQGELVEILKTQKIADVIIFGTGTSDTGRRDDTMRYSFKAVNISDSEILGNGRTEISSWFGVESAITTLANDAFSQLACEIMATWRPPFQAEIEVHNVSSMSDVDAILQAVRQHGGDRLQQVGTSKVDLSPGQGVAVFRIEYTCTSDELSPTFLKLSENLGFRLEFLSKRDNACVFNIVRKS